MADELLVDHTKLAAMAACSTRAAVRYALHLNPPGDATVLEVGSAVHAGYATWFETGGDVEEAVAVVKRMATWETLDARLMPRRIVDVFRYHLKSRPIGSFPLVVDPGHVEVAAESLPEAPLGVLKDGTPITFIALPDVVGRKRGVGGWWVGEHKTTSRLGDWWADDQMTGDQAVGQLWVVRQRMPEHTIHGVMIHGIEFPNPKTSTRRCPDHGKPYKECDLYHVNHTYLWRTPTKHEMVIWEATARKLAIQLGKLLAAVGDLHDVRTLPMEGRFRRACGRCELRAWCDQGRPAHGLNEWVKREWDPRSHAGLKRRRLAEAKEAS